jgi:hypothetical protein
MMSNSDLVSRLADLCANDTTFATDDYESFLADHAFEFQVAVQILNAPTYTRFGIGIGNLDSNVQIYLSGSTQILTETTDYTLDYQRGVFTTPSTEYRPLAARGTAYNLNLAAGDAWERIASRYVLEFDVTGVEGSYKRSQKYQQARDMASRFRTQAGVVSHYVERADQPSGLVNFADKRLYKRSDVTTR